MSTTIFEVLYNAQHNLKEGNPAFQQMLGRSQLDNVIRLLEKGKELDDTFRDEDLEEGGTT